MILYGKGLRRHATYCVQHAVVLSEHGSLKLSKRYLFNGARCLISATPCITFELVNHHKKDRRENQFKQLRQLCRPIFLTHYRRVATQPRSKTHFYEVLGVSPKASQSDIKSAYYRLSKVHHPDIDRNEGANVRFGQISEAYEILGNLKKRRMYDQGAFSGSRHASSHAVHHDDEEVEHDYTRPFREQENFGMQRKPPPTGRTEQFNFDEFYRQHYGEALKQKQINLEAVKQMEEMYEVERVQRMLRNIVTGAVIAIVFASLLLVDRTPEPKQFVKKT